MFSNCMRVGGLGVRFKFFQHYEGVQCKSWYKGWEGVKFPEKMLRNTRMAPRVKS